MQRESYVIKTSQNGAELDLYKVLRHPIRRRIIEILGEGGNTTMTQLRDSLSIPVGKLYYHLYVLTPLTTQDDEKKYMLTSSGREAYNFLKGYVEDATSLARDHNVRFKDVGVKLFARISSFLVPQQQSLRIIQIVAVALISILALSLGSLLLGRNGLELGFMIVKIGSTNPIISIVTYVASIMLTFVYLEAVSRLVFGSRGGTLKLLTGVISSYSPVALFSAAWISFLVTAAPMDYLLIAFFNISQVLVMFFLALSFAATKNIRLSYAIGSVLALAYANSLGLLASYI